MSVLITVLHWNLTLTWFFIFHICSRNLVRNGVTVKSFQWKIFNFVKFHFKIIANLFERLTVKTKLIWSNSKCVSKPNNSHLKLSINILVSRQFDLKAEPADRVWKLFVQWLQWDTHPCYPPLSQDLWWKFNLFLVSKLSFLIIFIKPLINRP